MDVALVRDWVIIVMGVLLIIATLITIVIALIFVRIAFRIQSLVNSANQQVGPILQTTSRTANTIAGTADFVSRLVVTPLIRILTALAAANRFIRVLLGGSRRRYQ